MRALIAGYDRSEFVLEMADNETGYKNVIKAGGRFQARLHNKATGKQVGLPGLFDTAEEAAKYRALVIRDQLKPPPAMPRESHCSKCAPPKPHAGLHILHRLVSHGLLAHVVRSHPRIQLAYKRKRPRVCPSSPERLRLVRMLRRRGCRVSVGLPRWQPRAQPWSPQ